MLPLEFYFKTFNLICIQKSLHFQLDRKIFHASLDIARKSSEQLAAEYAALVRFSLIGFLQQFYVFRRR